MAAELILAPEAEQDIAEAYAWYESRRAGLGEEFCPTRFFMKHADGSVTSSCVHSKSALFFLPFPSCGANPLKLFLESRQ